MIRRFLKSARVWPVGLAAFGTVFIAVNLAFVTTAIRNRPQLVSPDYYQEGYNLREIAERQAQGEATGWSVTARALPTDMAEQPLVELTVTEQDGAAADSLAGTVRFYRPADVRLDVPEVPLRYIGGGRYLAVLPRTLERGAWEAVVHVTRGGSELLQRVPFFVEG